MFEIDGDGAKASVMTDYIEDDTYSQIQEMINSEAIDEDVVIQADCHPGAGSVIGFTMPLSGRIVPNIVGVDVGCGVLAFEIGDELPLDDPVRESKVRDEIPMGREVNNYDSSVHFVNEFWWDESNNLLKEFSEAYKEKFGNKIKPPFDFDKFNKDYFSSLCSRVLEDSEASNRYIINSVATLGGGNHFIEFSKSNKTGKYWCVIHSGSRYLGKSIAEYWQDEAIDNTKSRKARESIKSLLKENPEYKDYIKFDINDVTNDEILKWITGGMDESFVDYQRIKQDYRDTNPKKIEKISSSIKDAVYEGNNFNEELAWLEGEEAHGYYVDMIFGQQYARFNRHKMMERICSILNIEPNKTIESTHNYIDFRDMIIRKGATPAREGEKLVIPFNMAEGTLVCEGKGNNNYLSTAPHGAGRTKSRGAAKQELSMDNFEEDMDGIYSESIRREVLEEAPRAYKDVEKIIESLKKTAEPKEHLEVVHNIKGY
jgi:RNA-splicing ligase RtcB